MSAEENMALARRFMEARVKGDVDALEAMLPPDFISHTKLLPEEEQGRQGVIWAAAQVAGAISNASVLVEDQVAQGEKVVSRFIVHSTHDLGEIMGVAPSGTSTTGLQHFPAIRLRVVLEGASSKRAHRSDAGSARATLTLERAAA